MEIFIQMHINFCLRICKFEKNATGHAKSILFAKLCIVQEKIFLITCYVIS